jgi:dipeptide/tripeptide permease
VGGISVFWQIPQYFLISSGEVMVAVTGLEFAYSQTPRSLKSVMSAVWYLCVGLGNVIVGGLSLANFCGASCMMFSYAGLLGVAAIIFVLCALRYVYSDELFATLAHVEEKSAVAAAAFAINVQPTDCAPGDADVTAAAAAVSS